jgi:CheY-like chemotaxis protein
MPSNQTRSQIEPPSILVVDDDDEVREMLAETLRDFGYAVIQATAGEEALEILAQHTEVIMVITDIRMPGMSGLDLAERVQRERAGVKVIVISGYFNPQPVSQRFLMKPFRLHELASAVRAELG